MEQMMETGTQEMRVGPRHAKPVTLVGRAKHALSKGPARWELKTYMAVIAIATAIFVTMGLALGVAVVLVLSSFNN